MTQKQYPMSSDDSYLYESAIKKAQKKEMSQFTSDYIRAFILALVCMPIVWILYVSFSIALKVIFA